MSNRRKETHCFWLLVSVIGTRVLIISTRTDTRGESAWIRRHQQHVKTHDKETLEPETVRVYTTTNADGPVSGGRPASSMHNDTSFSCLEAFCQSHLAGNRRLPSVYNRFHPPLEKWHRRFFVHFYTICNIYMYMWVMNFFLTFQIVFYDIKGMYYNIFKVTIVKVSKISLML